MENMSKNVENPGGKQAKRCGEKHAKFMLKDVENVLKCVDKTGGKHAKDVENTWNIMLKDAKTCGKSC